jgi:hypothetical protein
MDRAGTRGRKEIQLDFFGKATLLAAADERVTKKSEIKLSPLGGILRFLD